MFIADYLRRIFEYSVTLLKCVLPRLGIGAYPYYDGRY